MNRAGDLAALDVSVGEDFCFLAVLCEIQRLPGIQQSVFEQCPKWDARLLAFLGKDQHLRGGGEYRVNALLRDLDVLLVTFDADPVATEFLRDRAGGAGAEEGIEDQVARLRRSEDDPVEKRFGLLSRVGFRPVMFDALFAPHKREFPMSPVGAHLQVFIQGFHGVMIERVLRAFFLLRPDHCFVRVGKTNTAEIGHGVVFDPQQVVENPKAEVLHDRADAVDIVIRADDPDRACVFQYTPTRAQPVPRERVVRFEILELVPAIVHRIHLAQVGTIQVIAELQVIRRIGEDHIRRVRGERFEYLDAIAVEDLVEGERLVQ